MWQSVSKPRPEDMRVGKPEPYAPGKDFDDWDFTFNGYAGTLDPAYPALLKTARQSPTLHHMNSSLQPCCTYSRCSHRKEHGKWWGKLETTVSKLTDNCAWCTERPIRKAARDYSCKLWHTSLVPRLKTWKTVWKNFWKRWDDTMRRMVPIPFPTKWKRRALFRVRPSLWRHIFSWMVLNWETSTHYAWRLKITWGADASSRRLQPETHTMMIRWKSMQSPGKGKAKKNLARARRVARKENKATQAKVTEKRQQNTHASKVNVETVESMDTKQLIVGTSRWPNLKGTGKSKSKVTEISESDSTKQVDETCTPNTSAQQPNLSQVNTIGCADEQLWIFSLEDRKKRRYTVNWENQSYSNQTEDWKTEEHEFMIDSGCFGHVCNLWQRTT